MSLNVVFTWIRVSKYLYSIPVFAREKSSFTYPFYPGEEDNLPFFPIAEVGQQSAERSSWGICPHPLPASSACAVFGICSLTAASVFSITDLLHLFEEISSVFSLVALPLSLQSIIWKCFHVSPNNLEPLFMYFSALSLCWDLNNFSWSFSKFTILYSFLSTLMFNQIGVLNFSYFILQF